MNILRYIGNTPLVKINNYGFDEAEIFVKLESFNPGGSIKSRVALKMMEDAEQNNILYPNCTIIEPTGGNTGLGLSLVSTIKGYRFIAVVPDNYSTERINLLKLHNAQVILSNSKCGNDSHIQLCKKILNDNPNYICLDQFTNKSCISAHYLGTAEEILYHITPDAFCACIGSSGTFTGIGTRLKERNANIKLFAVQPAGCNVIEGTATSHKIQGVSLGIKPPLLDYTLIHDTIDVSFSEVRLELTNLLKNQGLFLGASSGANIVAARKVARILGKGKIVCTVAPDGGQYYISDFYQMIT